MLVALHFIFKKTGHSIRQNDKLTWHRSQVGHKHKYYLAVNGKYRNYPKEYFYGNQTLFTSCLKYFGDDCLWRMLFLKKLNELFIFSDPHTVGHRVQFSKHSDVLIRMKGDTLIVAVIAVSSLMIIMKSQ